MVNYCCHLKGAGIYLNKRLPLLLENRASDTIKVEIENSEAADVVFTSAAFIV